MTDKEIIEALIARDERVTKRFFFGDCRPLFLSIIRYVFSYEVDYDEFVNEFYLYLMENDAYRLRQFEGRSSIYQWMKVIAIRYFIAKRDSMIDNESKDALLESVAHNETVDGENKMTVKIDIEHLFTLMPNRRYVYVIRRLVLQEAEPKIVAQELGTNVDNLYNIKKRAIAALTEVALKEVEKYEKEIGK
ncbi:MAG: sigma-70 family RNA polymerase sigma factor [Bacteroidales bacterium]|nr:sigma-70 family RNA polymerase sigma factor [Bacteroidales bacterium]